jgi:hypothetical protein
MWHTQYPGTSKSSVEGQYGSIMVAAAVLLPDVRPCTLAVVGAFFHIVTVYGFQLQRCLVLLR